MTDHPGNVKNECSTSHQSGGRFFLPYKGLFPEDDLKDRFSNVISEYDRLKKACRH